VAVAVTLATLSQVDRSPAGNGSAPAWDLLNIFREVIVERQLFPASDGLAAHIEDVTLANFGDDIRITAMIEVFRSTAADRAIEGPIVVQREQVDHAILLVTPPLGFPAVDALAGILHYFAASWYIFRCVDAPAVNLRRTDFELETGVPGVDGGCLRI